MLFYVNISWFINIISRLWFCWLCDLLTNQICWVVDQATWPLWLWWHISFQTGTGQWKRIYLPVVFVLKVMCLAWVYTQWFDSSVVLHGLVKRVILLWQFGFVNVFSWIVFFKLSSVNKVSNQVNLYLFYMCILIKFLL